MDFPGYDKPEEYAVDAGVLKVGGTTVGIGATVGGLTFEPGKEYRNVEFDGKTTDIAENDRVISYNSTISGDMLELSSAALMRYEPGASSDGSSGTNTITPIDATVFLAQGDYLTDVYFVLRRSDNKTIRVRFAKALIQRYSM